MASTGDQREQPVVPCGGRVLGLLTEWQGPKAGEGLLGAEGMSASNLQGSAWGSKRGACVQPGALSEEPVFSLGV